MVKNDDGHDRFSLWQLICICAVVLSASVTATWYFARTSIGDELDQYRRSNEWKLPENLAALGELSKKVSLELKERQELEHFRTKNQELENKLSIISQEKQNQVNSLNNQLDITKTELTNIRNQLNSLQATTIDVHEGEAKFIIPKILAVGVKKISYYTKMANVTIGNKSCELSPGENLDISISGGKYIVTLLKIDIDSCSFSVTESNPLQ